MYKYFFRPILFLFAPETIHHFIVFALKLVYKIPLLNKLISQIFKLKEISLQKKVFGLNFKNPIGLAAGFDKNAELINELAGFGFGFIELGTVTPKAQPGNPKPRLFRLKRDKALINRMGFNNCGLEQFITNIKKQKPNVIIGANLGKNTLTPNDSAEADYYDSFIRLYPYLDYFVVNVSCPNVEKLQNLNDKAFLMSLLNKLYQFSKTQAIEKPILLKISPDLNHTQLDEIVEIILNTKIAGVIAANTSKERSNLITDKDIVERIGNGGLSGAPLKDKNLEIVKYLYKKSNAAFPIIGVGGILTPKDAINMLNAGASLVQIYTGFIYEGPFIVKKINKALQKELLLNKLNNA